LKELAEETTSTASAPWWSQWFTIPCGYPSFSCQPRLKDPNSTHSSTSSRIEKTSRSRECASTAMHWSWSTSARSLRTWAMRKSQTTRSCDKCSADYISGKVSRSFKSRRRSALSFWGSKVTISYWILRTITSSRKWNRRCLIASRKHLRLPRWKSPGKIPRLRRWRLKLWMRRHKRRFRPLKWTKPLRSRRVLLQNLINGKRAKALWLREKPLKCSKAWP